MRISRERVMQVQLTRWGNSLGLRIPKALTERFGLVEGEKVLLAVENDHIVISLPRLPTRIADLVADLTHDELAEAFDWGPDLGRERID
jgi:antitoxin MazE